MLIDLLGPLRVRDGDGADVPVAGTRLRRLLVELALNAGRPVSTAALEDVLWPGERPAGAGALQSLVSRLRRVLGSPGAVGAGPAGYVLALDPPDVDVTRFERGCLRGRELLRAGHLVAAAAELGAALDLWRGPLDEFAGSPQALRLEELHLDALADRAEADLGRGRVDDLPAELGALLAQHPLRERFAELRVRALHAAGRDAEALAAYEETRRVLADELGADPSPGLRAAHLDVLHGRAAPPPPRSAAVPALTSFVGRGADLERVRALTGTARCVTIVGPGGAGKTRLSTELVRAADSGVAVHVVLLAPVAEGADVLPAVVAAVGARDTGRDHRGTRTDVADPRTRLVSVLSAGPGVLLLDNCEHVLDEVAVLVEDLLRTCPPLTVLATSREALGVEGEVLHPLGPLRPPEPGADLDAVRRNAAVQLFADRAAAVSPEFSISAPDADLLADLVRRLDGLPLALELAAARLRTTSMADLHARLSDRFRLLTGGRRTAVARHRTLRAVVDWSWDLLDERERAVLQRLSVFLAPVSVEAATAVNPDVGDEAAVADVLASLTEKSLLQLQPAPRAGDPDRYALLETIREYGAERLAAAGGLAEVRWARTGWACATGAAAAAGLRGAQQVAWSHRLDAESEDLLAALRQLAAQGRTAEALDLALPVALWWTALGRHAPAREWLATARAATTADTARPDHPVPLAAGRVRSSLLVAEALDVTNRVMGGEAGEQDPPVAARMAELRGDLADARRDDDSPLLALVSHFLTTFTAIQPWADEALPPEDLPDLLGADPWLTASYDLVRGLAAENLGDIAAMASAAGRAAGFFRAAGESWGLSGALRLQGQAQVFAGDLGAAAASYAGAADLVAQFGTTDDEVQLRMRLLDVLTRLGRDAEVAGQLARMQRVAPTTSAPTRTWLAMVEVSLARRDGRLDDARALAARQSEVLARRGGTGVWNHERAALETTVAHVHLDDGDLAAAGEVLRAAWRTATGTRDMPIVAATALALARWRAAAGDPEEAAVVLGASVVVRGADDASDPDAVRLRERLERELGADGFARAFGRGRCLDRPAALERAAPGPRADEPVDVSGSIIEPEASTGPSLAAGAGGQARRL